MINRDWNWICKQINSQYSILGFEKFWWTCNLEDCIHTILDWIPNHFRIGGSTPLGPLDSVRNIPRDKVSTSMLFSRLRQWTPLSNGLLLDGQGRKHSKYPLHKSEALAMDHQIWITRSWVSRSRFSDSKFKIRCRYNCFSLIISIVRPSLLDKAIWEVKEEIATLGSEEFPA